MIDVRLIVIEQKDDIDSKVSEHKLAIFQDKYRYGVI